MDRRVNGIASGVLEVLQSLLLVRRPGINLLVAVEELASLPCPWPRCLAVRACETGIQILIGDMRGYRKSRSSDREGGLAERIWARKASDYTRPGLGLSKVDASSVTTVYGTARSYTVCMMGRGLGGA